MVEGILIKNRINNEIGEWLKDLRQSRGLSLKGASERFSLSPGRLAKFEAGRPVPMAMLARLVIGYEVQPEFVICKILEIQKAATRAASPPPV